MRNPDEITVKVGSCRRCKVAWYWQFPIPEDRAYCGVCHHRLVPGRVSGYGQPYPMQKGNPVTPLSTFLR